MKRERPLSVSMGSHRVREPFHRAKVQRGCSDIGRSPEMAKTPELTAKARESQQALKAKFKEKFGHAYDPMGYGGHPFFGSHCYGCGIHISQVTGKNLREQLELNVGEGKSGKRFSRVVDNAIDNLRVIGG